MAEAQQKTKTQAMPKSQAPPVEILEPEEGTAVPWDSSPRGDHESSRWRQESEFLEANPQLPRMVLPPVNAAATKAMREASGGGDGQSQGDAAAPENWWPAPEKLCGKLWEKPRHLGSYKLISDTTPATSKWQYPMWDESRRSFAGYLRSPLAQDRCDHFFETIRDGTAWLQPTNPWGGLMPRKTAWLVKKGCACAYRYGQFEVEPQEYPPWMEALLEEVMPFCGLETWPDSCNVNLYEDGGASVGWHSDDERLFQGNFRDITIISLSLGVARNFELRLNWPEEEEPRQWQLTLGSGDLMTMEGMCQKHFQHRVPREDGIQGPRINLTWRWVLKHTPQCPVARPARPGAPSALGATSP